MEFSPSCLCLSSGLEQHYITSYGKVLWKINLNLNDFRTQPKLITFLKEIPPRTNRTHALKLFLMKMKKTFY